MKRMQELKDITIWKIIQKYVYAGFILKQAKVWRA